MSAVADDPGRLRAIRAVAALAFRESARHRVLHALLAAMVLASGAAHVLAWVSGDDPARRIKVVCDVSLSAISLLGTLAAIFLGTHLVYQEIERRTVYVVLARPIGRASFLLGKFFGLLGILAVAQLVMSLVFAAGLALTFPLLPDGGDLPPPLPVGALALALVAAWLELVVVTAVALLFSVIAHPIEGAVFAFLVALAGHMTASLKDLGHQLLRGASEPGLSTRALVRVLDLLYVLLPDLEHFNLRAAAVHGLPLEPARLLMALAYAAVYSGTLLCLASLAFRRRTL